MEGLYRLLFSEETGPINLGNPEEITIKESAEEVLALTVSQSQLTFEPLPQDDPKVRCPDIGRAQRLLGWRPKIERGQGLYRCTRYLNTRAWDRPATKVAGYPVRSPLCGLRSPRRGLCQREPASSLAGRRGCSINYYKAAFPYVHDLARLLTLVEQTGQAVVGKVPLRNTRVRGMVSRDHR